MTRRGRQWIVPMVMVGLVLGGAAIVNVLPAAAAPNLAPVAATDLITKALDSKVTALSGTVEWIAKLGLPDVGTFGPAGLPSLATLLAGRHTADVAFDGPDHARVALRRPAAETDWIRNGTDLWQWESATQVAAHVALPAGAGSESKSEMQGTPAELAARFLRAVDPSTVVTADTPAFVAGRAAYELALAPKSAQSTIGSVRVAIDSATGLVLRVQVFAKHATDPAATIGFQSLSLKRPAASTFAFTPPRGAQVNELMQASDLTHPTATMRHAYRRLGAESGTDTGTHYLVDRRSTPMTYNQMFTFGEPIEVGTAWDSVVIVPAGSLGENIPIGALAKAATPTTLNGIHGRLLSTKLLSAFLADDGRVAAGFVEPAALGAALAAVPNTVHTGG